MMDDEEITQYNVRKYGAYIPVSAELLHEYGLLPDYEPTYERFVPTRRQRIKMFVSLRVKMIRIRVGEWVAGEKFECDHDDW